MKAAQARLGLRGIFYWRGEASRGRNQLKETSIYLSPLGPMRMESDGQALTGLSFMLPLKRTVEEEAERLPIFDETARWLEAYFFSGKEPDFMPLIRIEGSAFRKAVFQAISEIPYGQTASYGAIAGTAAQRQGKTCCSAQAVGGAASHNPLLLLIPCHRVVGENGELKGYAAGLQKKTALLCLEGSGTPLSKSDI